MTTIHPIRAPRQDLSPQPPQVRVAHLSVIRLGRTRAVAHLTIGGQRLRGCRLVASPDEGGGFDLLPPAGRYDWPDEPTRLTCKIRVLSSYLDIIREARSRG